jgi:calcium binding protein 39
MATGTVPKPFEWLSGGLFFGKSKGGIESVDSCNDVLALLKGIDENLTGTLAEPRVSEQESTVAAEAVPFDGSEPSQAKFLASRLSRVRILLYDERRSSSAQSYRSSSPTAAGATMQGFTGDSLKHLMPKLVEHLHELPFETRKHVAAIFNYLLVCGLDGADRELYQPIMVGFRDYVYAHFDEILAPIVQGHECGASDVGLHCGSMYRSCFKHSSLYRELVSSTARVEKYVFPFLDVFVRLPNFDISSDAMESLKQIFTAGCDSQVYVDEVSQREMAEMAAELLNRDYEAIWDQRFNPNLLSDQANYMTKRVALQILSTVLLTRSNYAIMIKYVNSRQNLILVMKLLRDTSPHITMDAFHVFKVFVANPSKIPEVVKILGDNKEKLCIYLETLHQDKEANDQQFRDEKALIIATIQGL